VKALLLDVGNSRLKWGVLEDGEIRVTGHISQTKLGEQGLSALTTRLPRRVDAVHASNVAGTSFATRLSGVIGAHCQADLHFARSERRGWGVTNGYRQPRRLGVDCLIVDAGTAVTLDAIDNDGVHLGGQIIPGVETMLASLSTCRPQQATSRL
jgi:type III pantothenate kinase